MEHTTSNFRVVLSCPDKRGVVAKVSAQLAELGVTILEAHQHSDAHTGHFFMRYEVAPDQGEARDTWGRERLQEGFAALAQELNLDMRISSLADRPRVALLATKASHCLVDLLQRWRSGELPCDMACVIANHPDMGEYADWYGVPFHHVDFKGQSKTAAFEEVDALLEGYDVSLTVLARFMQIIPETLIEKHPGRIINIFNSGGGAGNASIIDKTIQPAHAVCLASDQCLYGGTVRHITIMGGYISLCGGQLIQRLLVHITG